MLKVCNRHLEMERALVEDRGLGPLIGTSPDPFEIGPKHELLMGEQLAGVHLDPLVELNKYFINEVGGEDCKFRDPADTFNVQPVCPICFCEQHCGQAHMVEIMTCAADNIARYCRDLGLARGLA